MKKLLFTIQWYPSYKSPNVYCDTNIMNALLATGKYEIHCLVYKPYNRPSEEMLDGFHIHRFKRSWLFDAAMKADAAPDLFKSKLVRKLARLFMRLKQIVFVPIYPIYEPLLVRKFQREAVRLHRKEHFDLVISEHNGTDTLLAGYAVKKYDKSVKYLPVFWDSLSGGFCPHYLPEKYARKSRRALEKKVMSVADKAIVMESTRSFHQKKMDSVGYGYKFEYANLPKIVASKEKEDTCVNKILRKDVINIVYAGSLTQRHEKYIINLLCGIGHLINLIFFVDVEFYNRLKQYCEKFDNFKMEGYLPHNEMISVLSKADFLLNLGNQNQNDVQSKVFEYISLGKPIISTTNIDNEASTKFLSKYPLSIIVDERLPQEENQGNLLMFIKENLKKEMLFKDVVNIFPNCSPDKYVEIIERLIDGRKQH